MSHTTARTLQWIVIILIVSLIGGGVYHYFSARAAKINTTPTTFNTSGLVGYWTFDGAETVWTSTTAGTTLDKSGQNNTGTLTSMNQATSPVAGKIGQGLYFDGSNDYVNIGSVANDVSGDISIVVWVKANNNHTAAAFRKGTILAHHSSTGANKGVIFFIGDAGNVGNDNELLVFDGTTGSYEITTNTVVGDNKWHYIVYVLSGTTGTIYVDGVSKGTHTANWTYASNDKWSVGQEWDDAITSDFLDGIIDDVRIYNRALLPAEIATLYTMGTATVSTSTTTLNTNGLVGYWTFDGSKVPWTSSTAATATDSSGQNNTGTLTNMNQSTAPVIGKIGQGLNFDGSNDYVASGGVFSSLGTSNQPYSLAGWVMVRSGAAAGNIIHISSDSGGTGWCVSFVTYNGTKLLANSWNGGGVTATGATTLTQGIWYHFVNTWDASNGLRIYLNGVLDGSTAQATFSASGSSDYVFAGRGVASCSGTTGNYFNGRIDDVRIYNRALSAGEVADLYTMGTTTVNASTNALNTNGLVGEWSFAATTLDTSGQNNTGTLTNMSQSTSPTPGKIGQALLFDGVDDYVTTGNAGDIKTLSYWVNTNTNKFYATPYVGTDFYKDGVSASLLGSELITNGNFDSDVTGWSVDSASPISWVNGTSGDGSTGYLRFSTADNGNWDRFRKDGSVVSASTTYQVSFWYRTSGITGNLDVHLTDNFGGLTNRVRSVPITPTSGSWKYFSVVLTTESSTYPIFTIVKLGNVGVGTFDIDAISVKTLNASIGTGWHHIVTTSNNGIYASNMSIGKSQGTSEITGGYWTGSIDDVRVYNKALSADEVASLYNQGR